jgi:putative N6-adenine-specific DNA methylase
MYSDFLVITSPGLEEILGEEIRSLGIAHVTVERGAVLFRGMMDECMRANLCLRSAEHIIMLLSEFGCASPEELYEQAGAIDWKPWFRDRKTFSVSASIQDSQISHPINAALAVKDAIIESLREKTGLPPESDRYSPDVSVMLRLDNNHARIGIDTSGENLGRRGYRKASNESSPRATLAAGLVLASGWNGLDDLYNPFCGEGSIAIEAGLYARKIPPNLNRKKFGFMKLPWFDPSRLEKIVEEARSRIVPGDCFIEASDENEAALGSAGEMAVSAEVDGIVRFIHRDIKAFPKAGTASMLITSPPSQVAGTRKITELRSLYRTIGEVFRKRLRKSTAWVFSENVSLAKYIPLKPSEKMIIYNDTLRYVFLRYDIR